MWAQIGTRLLVFVPGSARVGVVYFDGGRAADGDEEEYGEVIAKEEAGAGEGVSKLF
jgi:hypothetical protein